MFTVERKDGISIDTVDVLVCGNGQWGGLGNSMFSNFQSSPVRAKGVSGLSECEPAFSRVILDPRANAGAIDEPPGFVVTSYR